MTVTGHFWPNKDIYSKNRITAANLKNMKFFFSEVLKNLSDDDTISPSYSPTIKPVYYLKSSIIKKKKHESKAENMVASEKLVKFHL